ncbi:MAG: hypothetical protein F2585_11390, partial [Actinobacteria bacterium]|nr:hypothetical protein [Actinomycetota bacterium]
MTPSSNTFGGVCSRSYQRFQSSIESASQSRAAKITPEGFMPLVLADPGLLRRHRCVAVPCSFPMLAGTVAAMGVLAVIVAAGLLGPLLAAWKRFPIPIVVGEIAAGIIIGPQLLDLVDPNDPLVATLHDAGFALLMFTVGLHLRLHDPALRRAAPRALIAVAATGLLAIPVGI